MKVKTKQFSHKLLALFLAVLMGLSCFTGVMSAYAATDPDYHDGNVEFNELAWAVLDDEETAAAALDYLDEILAGVNLHVHIYYDISVAKINIDGYIDSVSGLLHIADQAYSLLDSYAGLIGGDVKNIDLSPLHNLSYNSNNNEAKCGRAYREKNSAQDIVMALMQTIYSNTKAGNSVIKNVLNGTLNLGSILNTAGINKDTIYDLIGGLVGTDSTWEAAYNSGNGYENNMVYNIVRHLMYNAFTDYSPMGSDNYNRMMNEQTFDESAFELLTTQLLQQINVQVTYKDKTNSKDLFAAGDTNPQLKYTDDGNVYLFYYDFNADGDFDDDGEYINFSNTDNLFDFSYQALHIAWYSVVKDTLEQLNVCGLHTYDWDYSQYCFAQGIACNYSADSVNAWAQSVVSAEGSTYATVDEFLAVVQDDLSYDRNVIDDATGTWADIDSHTIFNKLCYSPLADKYFHMQTGPLNLCIAESGLTNLENFDWSSYTSILGGLNDFLVTALADFLPNVANVEGTVPTFTKTGNDTDSATIASNLVGNAAKLLQYICDATDKNVLNSFYTANGANAVISEANVESAMTPLLVSCIAQNLTMVKQIHNEKWNACKDFEGVAFVALEEYLSYVLPQKDYSALASKDADNKYEVTLEGTLLPMCRDAIAYVMYEYVPIYDNNGAFWDVYTSDVNCDETIFDLLNSVVCYYANNMGVGNLLGLCDKSGACLITTSNSLWDNINLALNKLLPIAGDLLGTGYGAADSHALIYDTLIKGLFNVGENNGLQNIVSTFATICNNDAISTQAADLTVYNLLKDLLNGLLGARYTNQTYTTLVKDATTDSPFDEFLQISNIAGASGDGNDIGALGKLVVNLVEFMGGYSYPDTVWPGAMFAVQAVNSFIPAFIPQISEYTLKPATVASSNPAVSSYVAGSEKATGVEVTNNSIGINRALIDSDGTVNEQSRYYVRINSITPDKDGVSIGALSSSVAPGDTYTVPVTATLSSDKFTSTVDGSATECLVTYTVNYSYVDQNGTVVPGYEELTANAYQYFTTALDWKAATYKSDGTFTESMSPSSKTQEGTYSIMSGAVTQSKFGLIVNGNACVQYPKTTIVKLSEIEDISSATVDVINNCSGNKAAPIQGIYAYNTTANGGYGDAWALVSSDASKNVVNVNYYDIYQNGAWVTDNPMSYDDANSKEKVDPTITDIRQHVVAYASDNYSALGGANVCKTGTDGKVYLNVTSSNCGLLNDPTIATNPTFSTGIDGIYFSFGYKSIAANGDHNVLPFLSWDGVTDVKAVTESSLGIMIYGESTKSYDNWALATYDDSEAPTLMSEYEQASEFLSQYKENEFTDYDSSAGQSPTYQYYLKNIKSALATYSTAVNINNASSLSSVMASFAKTSEKTSFYGDAAYVPATSVPESMSGYATNSSMFYVTNYKDANGTAHYENAVYSNTPLTDLDVQIGADYTVNGVSYQSGTDNAGQPVVKVDDVWYVLNEKAYESDWSDVGSGTGDFLESPYYGYTDVQKNNGAEKEEDLQYYYNQKQYVYRNAEGVKVTSKDDWTYKLVEGDYRQVTGSDYRGVYKVAVDKLAYANELAANMINVRGAMDLYNNVVLLREGLNNVNFGIVTYEKMVQAGQAAEKLITVDRYRTYTDKTGAVAFSCYDSDYDEQFALYQESKKPLAVLSSDLTSVEDESQLKVSSAKGVSSFEIQESIRVFNMYLAKIVDRGYEGAKLEEEINYSTGNDYSAMTATVADEDSSTPASVEATTTKYGAVENGVITNTGDTVYTDDSWTAYITALAAAVDGATTGNGDYAHSDRAYYDAADKDNYTLQVSDVYSLRTNLMLAENALTPVPESTGVTVTGTMFQMESTSGAYSPTGYAPGLTVTIGDLTTTTAADGTFTIENVPMDATTVVISGDTTVDRTITINTASAVDGTLALGDKAIVCCDYSKDSSINTSDASIFNGVLTNKQANVYCDIDGDGSINTTDASIFKSMLNKPMSNIYDGIEN